MIRRLNQLLDAKRTNGNRALDASELSALVEQLKQRNEELEREALEHWKAAADVSRTQADLLRAQRLAKIGHWRWAMPQGELIECSDEFARIHGVDPAEIREWMKHQMERVIHPDDCERVKRTFRDCDEAKSNCEIEYRIVRPDGEIRYVHEIGENVFDESGRIIQQIGTIQDVTELRRAEAALRAARDELERRVWTRTAQLEHANAALRKEVEERKRAEAQREEREMLLQSAAKISRIGYAVWDEVDRTYASVSEEYAQISGLTVEEFHERYPTLADDLAAIHPEDRERYRAFEEAYRANPVSTQIEYRFLKPSGEVVHVRELMQPVRDEDGRLAQSILTFHDITEQKRTEQQLRQSQKMEAVGQLTGGIAHDFNNLLSVIIGNLELTQGEIDEGAEAAEWIRTAIEAAERGASLTQRLLAFSRKQALMPVPVDVDALLGNMVDMLRRAIGEQIEIELVRDQDLWKCLVDPNQLENSIVNLAINARDAMPAGGRLSIAASNARINEDCARAPSDLARGDYVLIAVSDRGGGMTDAVRNRVFDPFFTTKEPGSGSGLGLSMVYGFIKQSGGHVSIDSDLGVGTTVQILLPRSLKEEIPRRVGFGESEIEKAKGEVVLLVEDDPELRSLLVRILRSLNYRVLEADSSARALGLIRSSVEIDLLLTDVVLPEKMSGGDIARAAVRARPDLRVLFMSGYTGDETLQRGQRPEGSGFLQKPFHTADFARELRRALASDERVE